MTNTLLSPCVLYDRESLSTRDLLDFPEGGSEKELLSVFAFLRRGNQNSRLHHIVLRELLPFSWRCINFIIEHLKSPIFGQLTSLVVNSPYYPAISDLETLTSLTVEILFSEYKTTTERPYSQGGVWCFPRNASLTSLTIKMEDCCSASPVRFRSSYTSPVVVLGDPSSIENCLVRNLKRLSFSGAFDSFSTIQLASYCPKLEHLELEGDDDLDKLAELTLPKSLTFFKNLANHCIYQLPIGYPTLHNLKDLTILNTRSWSYEYTLRPPTSFWSLSPLLKMPQLTRLCILSTDAFHENQEAYETFCTQLATIPNDSPEKPQLTFLDVRALFISRDTVDLLKKAFPEAEILFKIRFMEPIPEDNVATPITEYLAPVQLGPRIPCPSCGLQVEERSPHDHALVCANAITSCRMCALGCTFTGTKQQVRKHIPGCDYNVMSCTYCLETVHFSRFYEHSLKHHLALSHIEKPFLSQPYARTPDFEVTTCHSCKKDFASVKEAQNHGCTKIGSGFLLPQEARPILNYSVQ